MVQSSSHPQTSQAQSLAVLLVISDYKINLGEVRFLSFRVVSLPLYKHCLFSFHCEAIDQQSIMHSCTPNPGSRPLNIISGGLRVVLELLHVINDTEAADAETLQMPLILNKAIWPPKHRCGHPRTIFFSQFFRHGSLCFNPTYSCLLLLPFI